MKCNYKVIFVSNFINHHQKEMCDYFYDNCDSFFFVCMKKPPKETIKFGYSDLSYLPYIIEYSQNAQTVEKLIYDADVTILGDSANKFLSLRMIENKLTFIYSERLWKKGYYRRFIPICRKKVTDVFAKNQDKRLFVLAASCYLAKDLEIVGFAPNRCYRWGYFTPFELITNPEENFIKKEENTITWVGRLIALKHLEDLLVVLRSLKKHGYRFTLNIIGDGPEKDKWMGLTKRLDLQNDVFFMGSMPSERVREEMKKSRILVATSDFNEGWGAVINEGMNSICLPIISHAMGSSAFLIKNGINGLIYKYGSTKSLEKCLKFALDNPEDTKEMAIKAYYTIQNEYNGFIAAQRFLTITSCLLKNEENLPYQSGPMSISPLLKNNWLTKQ